MEFLGNANKDITTDPRHIRVNYKGVFIKKVNQHLYVNNVSLARDIARVAYGSYQKEFEPFILLTTDLSTDTDGNKCVEVFTSRIFRTRMYYDKKEKI